MKCECLKNIKNKLLSQNNLECQVFNNMFIATFEPGVKYFFNVRLMKSVLELFKKIDLMLIFLGQIFHLQVHVYFCEIFFYAAQLIF